MSKISNININSIDKLITPNELKKKIPIDSEIESFVFNMRNQIDDILYGRDTRKILVVGPSSIHNIEEAKEYGLMLSDLSNKVKDKFLIVMRVYFEKPRTIIGWKGLINDPHLDNSCDVNSGLYMARDLLYYLNKIGVPCGCEFLDTITPHYISDLISWGGVGARTSESQLHRQLVSGLSMPIGFKNGTDGTIDICGDAINSSKNKHCFMGINDDGNASIIKTKGNYSCHTILRGGKNAPNYRSNSVNITKNILKIKNIIPKIMIDCSHGNSNYDHHNQKFVFENVIKQIINGENSIIGLMLESNINSGKQNLEYLGKINLKKGISITDSCIDFYTTQDIILKAFDLIKPSSNFVNNIFYTIKTTSEFST
jgi:3-deoxy-7-phosphoheptulonate synthase